MKTRAITSTLWGLVVLGLFAADGRAGAGAGVKYLDRHTGLDGSSGRRGSGFGLDLGVVFQPIPSLRIGGVAQDVFDTGVTYSDGMGTALAYPRTTRIGAAFTPKRWGTVAVDLDDRLHVGAVSRPLEALALRSGFQSDLDGPGGVSVDEVTGPRRSQATGYWRVAA